MLVCACCVLQCAIYGNFSAPKAQEIIVSRGHTLELIRPADNGRLQVCTNSSQQLDAARHSYACLDTANSAPQYSSVADQQDSTSTSALPGSWKLPAAARHSIQEPVLVPTAYALHSPLRNLTFSWPVDQQPATVHAGHTVVKIPGLLSSSCSPVGS